jgi:hypothetical protein
VIGFCITLGIILYVGADHVKHHHYASAIEAGVLGVILGLVWIAAAIMDLTKAVQKITPPKR